MSKASAWQLLEPRERGSQDGRLHDPAEVRVPKGDSNRPLLGLVVRPLGSSPLSGKVVSKEQAWHRTRVERVHSRARFLLHPRTPFSRAWATGGGCGHVPPWCHRCYRCLVVVVVVVFTLTDRASTIPSNIRGCQSGTWSQRGTKVNGSHHGDNPLLRPAGIQIATKSYATLQAMAPTNSKTVHQTSFTPYREQPRSTRIVVAYPRPAFSATNRTNTFQPVLINNSKFLKATHRTKIRKIQIPRSMVVEALNC